MALTQMTGSLLRFVTKNGLKVTDAAIGRLKGLLRPDEFLRVNVSTAGCAGLSYKFSVDSERRRDDDVTARDGVELRVDRKALAYVQGSTIDFVSEPFRQYFMLRDNPQASGVCSCGESFEVPGLDIVPTPCR